MKANIPVWVLAASLVVGGCSGDLWKSKNTMDEQKFAKFGQKKVQEDAQEGRENVSAELLGKESILNFGGSKQTQEQVRLNKLFNAALEVVMELPIQVANREGGFISTDWKVDPNDGGTRYRLNIRVSGQAPIGEVKVVVLKQSRQRDGAWLDQPPDVDAARNIEKAIRKVS
ncbi:MAG: DUF3576 domain-containing protein [Magnetococcales bacterium]|nr:DUF3576 domain-containing protein [Magnetococcales bacterium]